MASKACGVDPNVPMGPGLRWRDPFIPGPLSSGLGRLATDRPCAEQHGSAWDRRPPFSPSEAVAPSRPGSCPSSGRGHDRRPPRGECRASHARRCASVAGGRPPLIAVPVSTQKERSGAGVICSLRIGSAHAAATRTCRPRRGEDPPGRDNAAPQGCGIGVVRAARTGHNGSKGGGGQRRADVRIQSRAG